MNTEVISLISICPDAHFKSLLFLEEIIIRIFILFLEVNLFFEIYFTLCLSFFASYVYYLKKTYTVRVDYKSV